MSGASLRAGRGFCQAILSELVSLSCEVVADGGVGHGGAVIVDEAFPEVPGGANPPPQDQLTLTRSSSCSRGYLKPEWPHLLTITESAVLRARTRPAAAALERGEVARRDRLREAAR